MSFVCFGVWGGWAKKTKEEDRITTLFWSTISNPLNHINNFILNLERIAGIEPASSPWQGEILPFDYIRILSSLRRNIHIEYICLDHICAERGQIFFSIKALPIKFEIFFISLNSFKKFKFDPSLSFFCLLFGDLY